MHIPYRSMLPKGIKGLLVAGRATGGDRVAHAATRNMACCAVGAVRQISSSISNRLRPLSMRSLKSATR